jgi:hypothetical protein
MQALLRKSTGKSGDAGAGVEESTFGLPTVSISSNCIFNQLFRKCK